MTELILDPSTPIRQHHSYILFVRFKYSR